MRLLVSSFFWMGRLVTRWVFDSFLSFTNYFLGLYGFLLFWVFCFRFFLDLFLLMICGFICLWSTCLWSSFVGFGILIDRAYSWHAGFFFSKSVRHCPLSPVPLI